MAVIVRNSYILFMRAVVALGIVVAVIVLLMSASKWLGGKRKSSFIPRLDNDKEVFIRGWIPTEIPLILEGFRKMYRDVLSEEFAPKTEAFDGETIRMTFPQDLPDYLFAFLINYFRYPEGLDEKGRAILIVGKSSLTEDFEIADDKLYGREAVFYVPANDGKYDLVYVQVKNETYENSFASRRWKKVTDPRLPEGIASLL